MLAKIATRNTRKLRAFSNSPRATANPDKNGLRSKKGGATRVKISILQGKGLSPGGEPTCVKLY